MRLKMFVLATLFALALPAPIFAAGAEPAEVESELRAVFADAPVMVAIAKCESGFRQFGDDGAALRGGNGSMIGIFQIDEVLYRAKALDFGYDIDTVDGNIGFARYLYNNNQTTPWLASFSCWNQGAAPSPTSAEQPTRNPAPDGSSLLTKDLSLGIVDPQVYTLQSLLNQNGFAVADAGPGSRGNETTKFGTLTRDAVRRFQCAQNIVCAGDEYTTSYGVVGPRTRAALVALVSGGSTQTASNHATTTDETAAQAQSIRDQIASLLTTLAALQAKLAALTAGN